VPSENVELVRRGFEAWARGDVDELVALLDPEVYWRGIERGHLWWRRAPT
jgi:ketosteroid isomerase-like protein